MSDNPTDEQGPEDEAKAKPGAEAELTEEKRPAAKAKPAAKPKPAAEKKPAVKKPAAKKPAAKKPAAEKASTAKAEKPADAEPEKAATPKPEKAATPKPEKAAVTPARDSQSGASARARRKVVRAEARYVRTSARKARMVCGHLRGKSVEEARAILAFTPREVARDWSKLLESAVANAENNHELIEDDLLVREAYADEGPTIKRFRPRAQGRATPIRKRTSHLTITLTPKP
jgi:ribosomal protein L22